MSRASARADRRRSGSALLAAPVWALMLLAVFLCCSPAATPASHTEAPSASAPRALTPVHTPEVSVVTADAPAERGVGSSCHGPVGHSAAVVLPGHPSPPAPPCSSAPSRTAPLTGAAAVRGPSNDSVDAVDQLRLQVRRT
ncbi:hypothetical protein ABZ172_01790 [Streptomyces sp. NPDC006296]|uniref:hypothetical protein n=1 Tax=Streptomyces sp. NPDC006296 TaxID=3156746 RepID=UPI0033AEC318